MTQSIETILLTLLVLLTLAILTDAASARSALSMMQAAKSSAGRRPTAPGRRRTTTVAAGSDSPEIQFPTYLRARLDTALWSEKCGHERPGLDESTPRETQIISTMRHSE
jgi:hypothetical protein